MRFLPFVMLPVVSVMLLSACSSADEPAAARTGKASAAAGTVSTAPAATATASASASAKGAGAVSVSSDDGVLEFTYKHPAEVGAIPQLAASLKAQADQARAEAHKTALEDRGFAKAEKFPFHTHSLGLVWEVVTQTPRFLSLSNSFYTFTGGAHGNYGFEGMVWDRQAGKRLAATDLFVSTTALKAAVLKPFCAGLDAERRKKGIQPPEDGATFARCIDPVREATILPGSSDRRRINRLGFMIDPYVAGSYAEGSYEVTLPVTSAVLAAVKPEYRDAFAVR